MTEATNPGETTYLPGKRDEQNSCCFPFLHRPKLFSPGRPTNYGLAQPESPQPVESHSSKIILVLVEGLLWLTSSLLRWPIFSHT